MNTITVDDISDAMDSVRNQGYNPDMLIYGLANKINILIKDEFYLIDADELNILIELGKNPKDMTKKEIEDCLLAMRI